MARVWCLVMVAALFLAGCSPAALSTRKLSLSELSAGDYFPLGCGLEDSDRLNLVSTLKSLQERPLAEVGPKAIAYRFIWLRSFHQPVSVMVSLPDSGVGLLVGKVIELEPRRSPSEPLRHDQLRTVVVNLPAERCSQFKASLARFAFSQIDQYDDLTRPPLYDFELFGKRFSSRTEYMKDGARWVMEGWNHGTYRVCQRQSPAEEDALRQMAIFMLTEAKLLPTNEREIY